MLKRFTQLLPSLCAILVGGASFAISYNTLRLEAVAVGAVQAGWPSYLLPLILDGGVIAGSAVLWKASEEQRQRPWFAYLFVAALVLLSVVVNIAHSGPTLLAQTVAALPPLVLLGCLELVVIANRTRHTAHQDATEREGHTDPAPAAHQVHTPPGGAAERKQPTATAATTAATEAQTVVRSKNPGHTPVDTPNRRGEASPAPKTPVKSASTPGQTSPARKPQSSGGKTGADKVKDLFMRHLENGGSATDPSLSRRFSAELELNPSYVRRVLAELRRTADSTP